MKQALKLLNLKVAFFQIKVSELKDQLKFLYQNLAFLHFFKFNVNLFWVIIIRLLFIEFIIRVFHFFLYNLT